MCLQEEVESQVRVAHGDAPVWVEHQVFSPAKGNVAFASATFNWAFRIDDFAKYHCPAVLVVSGSTCSPSHMHKDCWRAATAVCPSACTKP